MQNTSKISHKILAFHDIHPTLRMGINTYPTKKFEKLIALLIKKYNLVTVSEILKSPEDESLVAITFDDGYKSVYEYAFPILKKYSVQASVMLISGFIGKKNEWDPSPLSGKVKHLNERRIKELVENGWEMAPHGFYHFAYTGYNSALIKKDLEKSRGVFDELGLKIPEYLSLPFGITDTKVIPLLKDEFPYLLGMLEFKKEKNIVPRYPVYGLASVYSILNDMKSWPDICKIKKVLLGAIHSGARLSARWQKWFGEK